MKKQSDNFRVNNTIEISKERVASILCNAFEGGSNYWYMIRKAVKNGQKNPFKDYYPSSQWIPLVEGGYLLISAEAAGREPEYKKKHRLDLVSIAEGLEGMHQKYPKHFVDMQEEGIADANTGDVFLQCCLFGEIIYG